MRNKILSVSGMRVPRLFVFIHGFISGRFKVAGLDTETGYICSGYIIEKKKLYDCSAHSRVNKLEDETREARSKASEIIAEEAQIHQLQNEIQAELDTILGNEQKPETEPKTIQEIRDAQNRRADRQAKLAKMYADQDEIKSKHRENIKRLGKIDEKIRSCELRAQEELEATASKLQSIFATYTKGALFRPVLPKYIPTIDIYDFELYKQSHKLEDQQIRNILMEVYEHE